MSIKKLIRKDLENYVSYKANAPVFKSKLDANESPYRLSENVRERILEFIKNEENFNIYPDTDSNILREELAKFYSVDKDNIICGVGSDQIIELIIKTFLNISEKVGVFSPTFSMYQLTTVLNYGEVKEFFLDENFEIDIDKTIEEIKKSEVKILFVCAPNNPTGNTFSLEEIEKIAQNFEGILVVDEAYGEFADFSMIPRLGKYENVIVLKTFSKAYGLAGLRVGFGIASKELIDALNLVKPPFNLSTFSQFVAVQVLKDYQEYQKRIQELMENRDEFIENLNRFQFIKTFPTKANFVYLESSKKIYDYLKEQGIIVRFFGFNNGLEKLRVTISKEEEMSNFIKVLKEIG